MVQTLLLWFPLSRPRQEALITGDLVRAPSLAGPSVVRLWALPERPSGVRTLFLRRVAIFPIEEVWESHLAGGAFKPLRGSDVGE